MRSLIQATTSQLCLFQSEAAVYDQVVTDEDRGMPLSRSWCRSAALWSLPCHYFQIQNVDVVEVVLAVPATKNVHFGASDDIGGVVKSGWRCSSASGALIPSHSNWIERMQILIRLIFASFATKYDNSGTCKQSGMAKPLARWSTLHLWLDPST